MWARATAPHSDRARARNSPPKPALFFCSTPLGPQACPDEPAAPCDAPVSPCNSAELQGALAILAPLLQFTGRFLHNRTVSVSWGTPRESDAARAAGAPLCVGAMAGLEGVGVVGCSPAPSGEQPGEPHDFAAGALGGAKAAHGTLLRKGVAAPLGASVRRTRRARRGEGSEGAEKEGRGVTRWVRVASRRAEGCKRSARLPALGALRRARRGGRRACAQRPARPPPRVKVTPEPAPPSAAAASSALRGRRDSGGCRAPLPGAGLARLAHGA